MEKPIDDSYWHKTFCTTFTFSKNEIGVYKGFCTSCSVLFHIKSMATHDELFFFFFLIMV